MERELFSIKGRSSKEGKHISGAERIVEENEIISVLDWISQKIIRNQPDEIVLKIEKLKKKPTFIQNTLPIKEFNFSSYIEANRFAIEILNSITGIKKNRLNEIISLVHNGASPSKDNMRGAMIVDERGNRIELDKYRGVRTTNVDFIDRKDALNKALKYNLKERTIDALAIATKNLNYPDLIAEYCISDEPDYTIGYVATKRFYYRLNPLKKKSNNRGGRIYFVKISTNLKDLYNYLQNEPILILTCSFPNFLKDRQDRTSRVLKIIDNSSVIG